MLDIISIIGTIITSAICGGNVPSGRKVHKTLIPRLGESPSCQA